MPPKAKYTREEIIETALNIVAEKGKSALNARDLGAALGLPPARCSLHSRT